MIYNLRQSSILLCDFEYLTCDFIKLTCMMHFMLLRHYHKQRIR